MVNLLESFNKKQMQSLDKHIPDFRPGDTISVVTKVFDGESERKQTYQGVCTKIKRRNSFNFSFVIRRMVQDEYVEMQFFPYAPNVVSIDITKHGKVRRAKLYYMRKLSGKAARIAEVPPSKVKRGAGISPSIQS